MRLMRRAWLKNMMETPMMIASRQVMLIDVLSVTLALLYVI
jgi:hypothetical protein